MCMAPNDGSGVRVGRKGGHDGDQLMGGCNPAAGGGQEVHTPPHKDRPPDASTPNTPPPSSATSLAGGRVHTRRSPPEEGSPVGNQHQPLAENHHGHLPHRRRRPTTTFGHARKRSGEDDGPGSGSNLLGGMERRSKVARGSAPSSPPAVNGLKLLNGCVNGMVNEQVKAAALLDRLAGLPGGEDVMMMSVEKRGRGQHNNHLTRNNHHHHSHNNHRHNNHLHNNHNHSNGLINEVLQNGVEHLLEKNGLNGLNGSVVGRRVNGITSVPTPTPPTSDTSPNNNNNTSVASPMGPKAEKRLNGVLTRLTPTHAHYLRRGVGGNHTNDKNHLHTNNNIEPPTLLPPAPTTKVITPHSDSSSSPIHPLNHPPSPPISPPSLLTCSSSSSPPPSPSSSTHRATQGLLVLPEPPPPQGLTFNCDAGLTPPTPSSTPTPPPAALHNNNSTNNNNDSSSSSSSHLIPTHNNHHHHHHHHHHHPPPLSPTPARCSAKSSPPPAHSAKSRSSSASSSSGVGSSAPSSAPSSGTSTPTPTTVRFPPPQKKEPADVCRWRECNLTLDPAASLLEHIQAVHVEGQLEAESFRCLWVGCKVYDKASCSVSWLERHVLTHGGHKPFKCIVDGCGQRFSSQTALGRHVNHHFNSTATTPSPRPPSQPSPSKLIRKNGRKCRYRKKPWSARMFDVFDVGVMERVRWRLMCVTEVQNGGIPQAPNNAFTVRPQVLARRASPKGSPEVLVKWCPSGVLPDEWIPLDQLEPSRVIPLEKLSPEAKQTVAQLCYPTKPPPQKHRRKRPACPKSVSLLEGSKEV